MWKISALAVLGVIVLSGCSEVGSAIEQGDQAASKARVCGEALGLVDLNPNVDPEKLRAKAEEKANRLRELGNEVADQTVRENLFAIADGYLELEQRKLDNLDAFHGWLQRNLSRLDKLRQACL
jgi:hypothetical protein